MPLFLSRFLSSKRNDWLGPVSTPSLITRMSLRYPIGAASGVDVVSGVKVLGVVDVSLISISTPVTQAVKEQMLSKPNIICGPKNVIFRYGRIWSTSLSTPNNHVQMHTWYPVVSLLYVLGAERKTPMKDRLALES